MDDAVPAGCKAYQAEFLSRRQASTPPLSAPRPARPLRWRLDDRLGIDPLCDLIQGRTTHGRWQQVVAIVTVLACMTEKGFSMSGAPRLKPWRKTPLAAR